MSKKQTHPEVALIDFGLSTVLLTGYYSKAKLGTIAFMAPEVASCKEHSHAADVWSLGIVLCVMLTGHIPFVSSRGVE